jgi:hypothetical protein
MNVVIDKVRWKVCPSKQEEINRKMGNMYVMWGFVLCCRFTQSVVTEIKWRRKKLARHVTFARKVRHTYTVFFVRREEKGLVETIRQRLIPK